MVAIKLEVGGGGQVKLYPYKKGRWGWGGGGQF